MKIAIGCDHGGFELKEIIKEHLLDNNEIFDEGCFNKESVDYPLYAKKVADKINSQEAELGILVCGSGLGISMAANKIDNIRAALCTNEYMAEMARKHNDANIICLGGRNTTPDNALRIVDTFLTNDFEGGRHQRRVDMIEG